MGQRREILERLESLERRLRHDDHGHGCGHHHHDHGRDRGGDFDEKRVIDTIVRCVTEQVEKVIESRQAEQGNRSDGGGEKRIVDLIVACVSEHVQEIVATELDKRLGKPDAKGSSDERAAARPGRRGGPPETEPA